MSDLMLPPVHGGPVEETTAVLTEMFKVEAGPSDSLLQTDCKDVAGPPEEATTAATVAVPLPHFPSFRPINRKDMVEHWAISFNRASAQGHKDHISYSDKLIAYCDTSPNSQLTFPTTENVGYCDTVSSLLLTVTLF